MALHNFVCDDCGVNVTDTQTKEMHYCPKCGAAMRWDLRVNFRCNYKHPIHSDSLAVPLQQVEEHRRQFPDIELDKEGRPIFNNYNDHEAYLEKTGFVKLPQKLKPQSTRIV